MLNISRNTDFINNVIAYYTTMIKKKSKKKMNGLQCYASEECLKGRNSFKCSFMIMIQSKKIKNFNWL